MENSGRDRIGRPLLLQPFKIDILISTQEFFELLGEGKILHFGLLAEVSTSAGV